MGIDKVIEVEVMDGKLYRDGKPLPLTDHSGAYYMVPKEVAEDLLSSREQARREEERKEKERQKEDASFRTVRMPRKCFDTFPHTITVNGVDYFLTIGTEELPGKVVLVRYLSLENSLDKCLDDNKQVGKQE